MNKDLFLARRAIFLRSNAVLSLLILGLVFAFLIASNFTAYAASGAPPIISYQGWLIKY